MQSDRMRRRTTATVFLSAPMAEAQLRAAQQQAPRPASDRPSACDRHLAPNLRSTKEAQNWETREARQRLQPAMPALPLQHEAKKSYASDPLRNHLPHIPTMSRNARGVLPGAGGKRAGARSVPPTPPAEGETRRLKPKSAGRPKAEEPNTAWRLVMATGHPSPFPPCLAGRIGRSRWTKLAAPLFFVCDRLNAHGAAATTRGYGWKPRAKDRMVMKLCGCLPLAAARLTPEEQRLARDRRNHGQLERLGNEERRFRPGAGQKPLWISGDEDHGDFKRVQ